MTHHPSFLQADVPPKGQVRTRRRTVLRRLFVLCVVLVVGWMCTLLFMGMHVTWQLIDARDHLIQTRSAIERLAFEEAQESLVQASGSLESVQRVLPFMRTIRWVPVVGASVESMVNLLTYGESMVSALEPLVWLGRDVVRLSGLTQEYLQESTEGLSSVTTFDDLSLETKRAILQRLSASADEIQLLVTRMTILEEELMMFSATTQNGPLLSSLDPLRTTLQDLKEPLRLLAVGAKLLPAFGGLDSPSSILLLFLNHNELRPGGGFIGTYGVLQMEGGDITQLETVDVYALDRAVADKGVRTAPVPLQTYNQAQQWFFRDSNWSPDVPTSAQQAITLFLEEVAFLGESSSVPVHTQVDHLIGFTPAYASDLLAITGPVTIGAQTFTAENVADLLEYQVQFGFEDAGIIEAQRKEILADLVSALKSRLYALPGREWPAVLEATHRAIEQKQLFLFSTDPSVQKIIAGAGWDGSIASNTVDTLMVVDANLASLKSDPAVGREITYELYQNSSGQWVSRVSIEYGHTGVFDLMTTRYRTYTRVYAPLGTQLLSVTGSWLNDKTQNPTRAKAPVDVEEELGLMSFGTFTSVEPGEQHTLTFEFLVSPDVVASIVDGSYALTLLKQPGARNHALTLDLNFGKNVTQAIPAEEVSEWGDSRYRLNTSLIQDFTIDVRL